MRWLSLILIVYVAAVIETSLVDVLRIGPLTPDLLALVALVWLLTETGPKAFVVAGAVAFMGDLIAPGRLGIGAAWMLLIGYGMTRLRTRFPLEHLAWQVPAVAVTVALWGAATGLTGQLLGDVSLSSPTILARAAGVGLYTAAAAVPVLMVTGWVHDWVPWRQERWAGR